MRWKRNFLSILDSPLSSSSADQRSNVDSFSFGLVIGGILELLDITVTDVPIDPVCRGNKPRGIRVVGIEVLVNRVGRNVNAVSFFPLESFGFFWPAPMITIAEFDLRIPVKIEAFSLENVDALLRNVTVFTRGCAGCQLLKISVYAVEAGVKIFVHNVGEMTVGRVFVGHVLRLDDFFQTLRSLLLFRRNLKPLPIMSALVCGTLLMHHVATRHN